MAYNELIKNFEKIRSYIREFYVYGFKSREEYTTKSSRSYDNERRRVESWLRDYMFFNRTADGKNIFISIDSRTTYHNPLYRSLKSKSFTDGDITLHFILFDILNTADISKSLNQIMEEMDNIYLSAFSTSKTFDESTVRKKLKEYIKLGLIVTEKKGKVVYYSRTSETVLDFTDALDFYSEVAPCGIIGSFLIDKLDTHDSSFAFKHHYITHVLDSEILLSLFSAMRNKCEIEITNISKISGKTVKVKLVPLNIFISVQNGRQYLLTYNRRDRRIKSQRLDYILDVKELDTSHDFDILREKLNGMRHHMWGVSTQGSGGRIEHVEFTIQYNAGEDFIYNRLVREKRCGTVEKIDNKHCKFTADVYDITEMIPWIRTFIGRITEINFSNKELENRFKNDIKEMYRLYGLNEDMNNDI